MIPQIIKYFRFDSYEDEDGNIFYAPPNFKGREEYYEGYNFDGWYLDSNFKTKYKNGTRLTNNITLYGKFVKISNPITRTIHTMYHKYIYLLILGVMFVCVVLFKIVRRVKFYRMEKSARK